MAEPTTTGAAVGWAAASGLLAAFLAGIGITWPAVFWATVGGVIGATFAPQVGRLRAMLMFPASSLLAAKGGMVFGAMWFAGDAGYIGGLAGLGGIVFHPAITALVQALPSIINRRAGG